MIFEIVIGLLFVWNVVVFAFYAVDKYKAVHHLWRIPERVLLTMALLAGGLGALLAGHICHHKTRKWYFQVCWYIGLAIDILLIFLIIKS
ncbi:DUF1294 domain-containing protein [Lactococcus nasutitermitis]|uniref:DUF1294 domain-containing protein n=1 Tax=Lactococcus nasutitermitis TaxID=1652957 RepID=A0ABV9JFH7_9LACT|nr:DUF1294 domain-containing protein [Lactococcus nasutitermitis]